MPAVVWLTERDNFDDCIDFWNVRALRPSGFNEPPMVLLPVDELEDWVDFNCQLQSTLFRPMLCNIDVIVISNGVDVDQLEYAARWLGLNPSVENIEVREEWPPPEPRQPPFMCKFNIDVSQFVGFEREYGSIYPVDAQVFRSNSRVRFRSPVRFSGGGRSLLLLSGQPFDGIPRRSIAASLVIRNATWQGDSIQIATNAQNNYNLNFSVPSVEQVRDKILESSVYDYELSDKGKIGRGIQSSSKLSSLLKGGVYEALSELVTPRSKTLMKEIKSCFDDSEITDKMRDLASRWGGRTERIFRPATQFEKVQKDIRPKVAEELCALGWAERGLKVSCPTCNIHSFVPINKADSVASCPGCSSVARYETVPSGPLVFYRLDSFIDLAVDQGVFPHLMVIAALEKSEPLSSFLPGVNLFFDEFGGYVEVDLFGVSGGKVMAGEVKTSVSEFTNERIERDVDLSKNLGVDVHILASVDVVSEDVRGFAQGLCESAGIELYVLDKSQLRPE
ncbi:hypothetical protein SAMN04487820_10971 [Actinopolyspora mzabensis]|uniref:Uncharacterized protein n=2 Tax=Actinopolyspora mzabensis TaxID=995066 RepID=A0A1G9CSX1_ACTMZ|nr:hypothetical protein SAMN04487820_10971 [Actinopolyspora mzabensis]